MAIPEKRAIIVLVIVSLINITMLFVRNAIENDPSYNFLLWNLFLGFLPLFFAYIVLLFNKGLSPFLLIAGSFLWLLFYPNAPYMMSDLIHVQAQSVTVIYDTLIIFSISTLALFYGFYSIKFIYTVWKDHYSPNSALTLVLVSIFLSSLGIYLGRILRLNSWDLFTKPLKVFADIFDHLWPVSENPTTYYIIILFSTIQIIILLLIRNMNTVQTDPIPEKKVKVTV